MPTVSKRKFFQLFHRWLIRIGDVDHISDKDDRHARDLIIQKITKHPKYNGEDVYYDVAILETEPISFSIAISPVCLPSEPSEDKRRYDNDFVELTGWGAKHVFGNPSRRLKRVSMKIFSQK